MKEFHYNRNHEKAPILNLIHYWDTKLRDIRLHNLTLNDVKNKKNYFASFKEKALKLSLERGSIKEISEELDIPYFVLS